MEGKKLVKGGVICFMVLVLTATFVFGSNVITVVMTTEPPRMDPGDAITWEAGIVTYNVYENLLKYNLETYDIEPGLATSWEIAEDGKSAVFHLRKGVRFHDGTPFNAEAVKFSLERTKALNRTPATYFELVTRAEIIDDYTIKFHTSDVWAFWEDVFATRKAFGVVSPTFVKAHATADDPWAAKYMYNHTCGTGAYIMEEWVHGEYVRMVKNPEYWGGWTDKNINTVFVKIVREPAVEELMIKKGEADIAFDVPETHLEALAEESGITVKTVGGMSQMFIMMKCNEGPLVDVRVRKAICYALDFNEIVRVHPGAVKGQGPIPRSMLGHEDTLPIYPYDPDVAKLLLADAGYKPGKLKLKLVYLTGLEWQRRMAILVKQYLADVGINLELQEMTWITLFPLITDPAKSPQMFFFYSMTHIADPHGILDDIFSPGALGPAGFNNGYKNLEVGRLLDEAQMVVDRAKRAEVYAKVNRILARDVPAVFCFEMPFSFVYRSNLKGVVPDRLLLSYTFYDLYRE